MKKIINLLLISVLSLFIISCGNGINPVKQEEPEADSLEYGSAKLKMFVPDYYLMAETKNGERAISPQTSYVQLSAYNSISAAWNTFQKISLDEAEKTAVKDAPEGFSGSVYTLVFSKVYAKTYSAGTLKVDLMNDSGTILTSGTNAAAVTVKKGENATTDFFTLPTDYTKSSGSLSSGEMKFCRYSLPANTHYTLHMEVTGTSYPDIVVFNENGTLADYYAIDDAEVCAAGLDFPASASSSVKYIGVWADDAYVSNYSINLYTDLTDFTFKDSSIGFWGGESYQINLSPIPSDAYLGTPVYTSSNENITVSDKGVISGSEEAEGTITVTYEGISHTIAVNVYEGATELSGVLSGDNLHWTKENSPYKVTGDCLVEEETQLIIDPGVKVYFTGNNYIKMNGSIYAVGTKDEPITITKAASYSGYWDGLCINGGTMTTSNTYTYSSGNILKYVNFSYANTPVDLGSSTYVDHCKFMDCSNSVSAGSGSVLINNEFENGLSANSAKIFNNIINSRLHTSSHAVVSNNTVNNANISLYGYERQEYTNNIFNGGSWELSDWYISNFYVQKNNFQNYTGTIISTTASHDSHKQTHFTGNYWGESQTAELIANEATGEKNVSFISDYRDNFNYTEVDYSDWQREPIEGAGYQGDGFIAFDYKINGYSWSDSGYYPESTDTALTIVITPQYNTNDISYVRIAQGYENIANAEWQTYTGTVSYTADTTSLVNGYAPIYVQLKDSENNISASICHEVPFDSPVITCNIADGAMYTDTSNQTLVMRATDGGNITEYDISVDGISFAHSISSYGNSYLWNYTIGIGYMYSGTHTITMKAWDAAGNLTTKEISIIISNTNSDVSSFAGSWNETTGQPLKDARTSYLWHLDSDGAEVDNDEVTAINYTNKTIGLGTGCSDASVIVEVPFTLDENAFTVEAFVHAEEGKYPAICVRNSDTVELYTEYGYLYYETSSGSRTNSYYRYPALKSNGDWEYMVFVYSGSYFAKYVNGILVCYEDGITNKLSTSTNDLRVYFYDVDAVDEIRISNAARSADEIKAFYDCAKDKITE